MEFADPKWLETLIDSIRIGQICILILVSESQFLVIQTDCKQIIFLFS